MVRLLNIPLSAHLIPTLYHHLKIHLNNTDQNEVQLILPNRNLLEAWMKLPLLPSIRPMTCFEFIHKLAPTTETPLYLNEYELSCLIEKIISASSSTDTHHSTGYICEALKEYYYSNYCGQFENKLEGSKKEQLLYKVLKYIEEYASITGKEHKWKYLRRLIKQLADSITLHGLDAPVYIVTSHDLLLYAEELIVSLYNRGAILFFQGLDTYSSYTIWDTIDVKCEKGTHWQYAIKGALEKIGLSRSDVINVVPQTNEDNMMSMLLYPFRYWPLWHEESSICGSVLLDHISTLFNKSRVDELERILQLVKYHTTTNPKESIAIIVPNNYPMTSYIAAEVAKYASCDNFVPVALSHRGEVQLLMLILDYVMSTRENIVLLFEILKHTCSRFSSDPNMVWRLEIKIRQENFHISDTQSAKPEELPVELIKVLHALANLRHLVSIKDVDVGCFYLKHWEVHEAIINTPLSSDIQKLKQALVFYSVADASRTYSSVSGYRALLQQIVSSPSNSLLFDNIYSITNPAKSSNCSVLITTLNEEARHSHIISHICAARLLIFMGFEEYNYIPTISEISYIKSKEGYIAPHNLERGAITATFIGLLSLSVASKVVLSSAVDSQPTWLAMLSSYKKVVCGADLAEEKQSYDWLLRRSLHTFQPRSAAEFQWPCPDEKLRPIHYTRIALEKLICNPYAYYVDEVLNLKPLKKLRSDQEVLEHKSGLVMRRTIASLLPILDRHQDECCIKGALQSTFDKYIHRFDLKNEGEIIYLGGLLFANLSDDLLRFWHDLSTSKEAINNTMIGALHNCQFLAKGGKCMSITGYIDRVSFMKDNSIIADVYVRYAVRKDLKYITQLPFLALLLGGGKDNKILLREHEITFSGENRIEVLEVENKQIARDVLDILEYFRTAPYALTSTHCSALLKHLSRSVEILE